MTWLFVGRAFAGVFGASFSTAGAYIGDISNDDNRAEELRLHRRGLGLRFHAGAGDRRLRRRSTSMRARHSSWPPRWRSPTWRSASSRCRSRCRSSGAASSSGRARNPFGAFKSLAHLPMVAGLLFAVFLYQMAHDSLPAVWMFYTQHKFGWGPAETGWSLTFVGVMTVIVMGGLTGYVVPKLGERARDRRRVPADDAGLPGLRARAAGLDDLPGASCIGSLGGIANPGDAERDVEAGGAVVAGRVARAPSPASRASPPSSRRIFMTQLFSHFSVPGRARAAAGRALSGGRQRWCSAAC